MKQFLIRAFFGTILVCSTQGYAVEADRIVGVVNSEAITQSQLRVRMDQVRQNLKRQREPMPPEDVFERQVLEQVILERVQLQQARNASIQVDDGMVDRAIGIIAENNQTTVEKLRATLEKDGVPWNVFREDIRTEITLRRLREIEVENRVSISDAEVTNFLKINPDVISNKEYRVAHIVLTIPEDANEAKFRAVLARAEKVKSQLDAGMDFAAVAAGSSDAPDKTRGGEIGWRSRDTLPGFYAEVVSRLKSGEISPPLRGASGLFFIKLLEIRQGAASTQSIGQTHARHILLKTSALLSDTEAQVRLNALRERIMHGADFAELARASSADLTAARGGDLGWLNPGDTVPEFEKAMNALTPNQVSEPVHSPFGWHLIQVLERRQQDMSEEVRRNAARAILRQRKAEEAFDDWLRQLRDGAYVENRLDNADE